MATSPKICLITTIQLLIVWNLKHVVVLLTATAEQWQLNEKRTTKRQPQLNVSHSKHASTKYVVPIPTATS